jgi:hypothetical protein
MRNVLILVIVPKMLIAVLGDIEEYALVELVSQEIHMWQDVLEVSCYKE